MSNKNDSESSDSSESNDEKLSNYLPPGEGVETSPQQVQATHVAIDVTIHRQMVEFFQTNLNISWAQSNPFVVGLMQGKAIALAPDPDPDPET